MPHVVAHDSMVRASECVRSCAGETVFAPKRRATTSQLAQNNAISVSEEVSQSLVEASGACDQMPAALSAITMLNCSAIAVSSCPVVVDFGAKRAASLGVPQNAIYDVTVQTTGYPTAVVRAIAVPPQIRQKLI